MRALSRLAPGVFLFTLSAACGGGGGSLTPAQVAALQSGLEMQLQVAAECAPDSGPCKPSRVRALERAAYCDVGGVLSELGSAPDAGVVCPK